jgi:hypothetical protein
MGNCEKCGKKLTLWDKMSDKAIVRYCKECERKRPIKEVIKEKEQRKAKAEKTGRKVASVLGIIISAPFVIYFGNLLIKMVIIGVYNPNPFFFLGSIVGIWFIAPAFAFFLVIFVISLFGLFTEEKKIAEISIKYK